MNVPLEKPDQRLHLRAADGYIELGMFEGHFVDRAQAHLKRATEIDAEFRLMALEDPDLEPLWASLAID